MESAVVAAIIIGSLSLLSLVYQKYWEKRREIEQELRKKKAEIYEKFMRMWLMFIPMQGSDQENIDLEEIEDPFKEIAIGLTIWGSDDVVRKWSSIRRDLSPPSRRRIRESASISVSYRGIALVYALGSWAQKCGFEA